MIRKKQITIIKTSRVYVLCQKLHMDYGYI